ncbi:MAG: solute carrier family 26 protein [Bacteroidota bacterium]
MLRRYFPILDWLPKYKKAYASGDISAGFTVGVMLVPQGMAYALIAGLPPVYGLYAALVPNLVYAFMGSSRKLAVGPVALDSLIVASGLVSLKLATAESYLAMALFLALFVGVLQLVMGFLKMGFLANFLSRPVVSGFTSAAALVIAISQLKYLLGLDFEVIGTIPTLKALGVQIFHANFLDLAIGLSAIGVILLLKKIHRKLPAAMMVVVLSIAGVYLFSNQDTNVQLVGLIPEGLPNFTMPRVAVSFWPSVFPIALALAFISFAEAMTMAKAVEKKSKEYVTDANQELRALGMANILGSFFQSYPANAGLSRTAVNVGEGAKTGMAAIISAGVVALTLLFLTPYFQFLPKAVLGAIILVAVYGLIDIKYPKQLFHQRKDEFALFVVTFLTTILIGISQGIIFGVLFSVLLLVNRTSKPHIAILGKIRGTDYFKNINRFSDDIETAEDILVLRFDGQLYFANIAYFKKELYQNITKKGTAVKHVILNAESINYMDSTAVDTFHQIVEDIQNRNMQLYIAGAIGPIRDIFQASGLRRKIGSDHFFVRTHEAFEHCTRKSQQTAIQQKISQQTKNGSSVT